MKEGKVMNLLWIATQYILTHHRLPSILIDLVKKSRIAGSEDTGRKDGDIHGALEKGVSHSATQTTSQNGIRSGSWQCTC